MFSGRDPARNGVCGGGPDRDTTDATRLTTPQRQVGPWARHVRHRHVDRHGTRDPYSLTATPEPPGHTAFYTAMTIGTFRSVGIGNSEDGITRQYRYSNAER